MMGGLVMEIQDNIFYGCLKVRNEQKNKVLPSFGVATYFLA